MSSSHQPNDAPPSYDQVATGTSTLPANATTTTTTSSSNNNNLSVPQSDDAAAARKSMEDFLRPLPKGWIRQYDPSTHHNFFVDTLANPPRSIWVHPLDDEQYQRDHPEEVRRERERIEKEQLVHADTDDEDDHVHHQHHHQQHSDTSTVAGASSSSSTQTKGLKKFGRNLKDKMTNSTHQEREAKRQAQREAEQRAIQQHAAIRQALQTATRTGQPQLVGKDKQGREIYAQPPPSGAFGFGATLGYGPYQTFDGPYGAYGPYARPIGPYNRGYGYGGGAGLGMPMLGGLAGGMLLGGLLF
ncbi:uncharacterized protein MEPE_06276 [Melanopsichium pennsylvanicum]|uniref:WW domain-containing protein n=2 Tax=Melanopsichium pennsylvanicum TaxID=63383 RepID=A0AAJ4XT64_9BASI|nr:conserved hypothetical protein [Melanopsichium pennsylvanicum 4]SNX87566.1 uncharacterized protein MEPE_06276 [Melanopsichium pennsylvanicum]